MYKFNKTIKITNLIKRVIDIFLSALVLLVLSPIFILIGLMIYKFNGLPILYISHRMISPKQSIKILKFRTMVKDAHLPAYRLNERFMRDGYLDIPLDCEVYTYLGRILERTQLVETLQTINILKGQMSFVGNRPLPIENLKLLKKFEGWEKRFCSPCGITGIAQIAGKYKLSAEERINLEKLYSDIYIKRDGNIILCDALIIMYTIKLLFTGKYLGLEKSLQLLIKCGANYEQKK